MNIPKDQLVMGSHVLTELLSHDPKRIKKVFIKQEGQRKERKSDLLLQCEKKKIPVVEVSAKALDQMVESDSHQGIVIQVSQREFVDLRLFLEEERECSLVVAVDAVYDPQNLGTIIRTAECLGADALLFSKNRGSDITPVVAKASVGASEWLPMLRVSNLADSLLKFHEEGFEIVSMAIGEKAKSLYQHRFGKKVVLVLGSEGEGVSPLILKRSDVLLYIPMEGKIQSLNVAQAAAVGAAFYRSQNGSPHSSE